MSVRITGNDDADGRRVGRRAGQEEAQGRGVANELGPGDRAVGRVERVDLARLRGDDHQLAQAEPVLGERLVVLALVTLSGTVLLLTENAHQRLQATKKLANEHQSGRKGEHSRVPAADEHRR